jgi:hypothetical protein
MAPPGPSPFGFLLSMYQEKGCPKLDDRKKSGILTNYFVKCLQTSIAIPKC